MAISKIILNGVTQMDVTQDTVASSNLLSGYTATKNDGTKVSGSYVPPSAPTLQTKSISYTPTESAQSQTVTADSGYDGLSSIDISVGAISNTYVGSGITRRSSSDLSTLDANVRVPAGYYASLANISVDTMTLPTELSSGTSGSLVATFNSPTDSDKYLNIPKGYNSTRGYYKINKVASGTAGTPTATKGTVSDHSIAVTPSVTNTTGYITGGTKTGTAVSVSASELVNGTLSITSNGTKDVTNYASVNVNISGDSPIIESLEVTPNESEQTFNSSDVDGYKPVTVGAISSTYVGSGITRRSSTDLTASGALITAPSGYYSTAATYTIPSKDLSAGNITLSLDSATGVVSAYASITSAQVGYYGSQTTGNKTLQLTLKDSDDLTVSGATVTVPSGYYSAAASKSVTTMTLPSTLQIAATTGYTKILTIDRQTSTRYINIREGYNSTASYYEIAAVPDGSAAAPSTISGSAVSISIGTNTLTFTKTVSVTPVVSAGYVSTGTATNSSVSLTASVTVDPTPTASGATVTIPAGYYTEQTTKSVTTMTLPTSASSSATSGYTKKATISRSTSTQYINIAPGYNSAGGYYEISAVANGSATPAASINGTSATITTGTNTITLTKTVSNTPQVSAGYVSSGTAGNSSVSLTASVTTKAAATITPGTTNQTIAAGTYLTGAQTIAGDADLVGSNILSTANIFNVQGTVVVQNYYTGSSTPSSSLGQNGDIYIQQ